METRTILVTGATDGIGRSTAIALAESGHKVLLHGRSEKKLKELEKKIRSSGGKAESFLADFSSLSQVREMASKILAEVPQLDCLINNAGVLSQKRTLSEDGLEMTMAVNHFAPFLLSLSLLPLLQKSTDGRIVNVASMVHSSGRLDTNDWNLEKNFSGYQAYCISKLANVLFTYAFARRLSAKGIHNVTCNCLHPGVINTKLLRAGFGGIGGRSSEEGAETSVYLATSDVVKGISGKYFVDCREESSSAASNDSALAESLWQHSIEVTSADSTL